MSDFTLGTAQLGMTYGVVNDAGKPSRALARAIVRGAIDAGVTSFDTARAYGEAESILGDFLGDTPGLTVITKLDPLTWIGPDISDRAVLALVEESVERSCESLRVKKLDVLLLHRWDHFRYREGLIWRRLLELRAGGKIGGLGASVYEPEEAERALQEPEMEHLQLPFNILDWRWKAAGIDRLVVGRPEVRVYARSILLQGLLVKDAERWPAVNVDSKMLVCRLREAARKLGCVTVNELCFGYARSQDWISNLVVGCETMDQFEFNLKLFQVPPLGAEACQVAENLLPHAPESLLNPSQWPTATRAIASA